MSLVKDVLESMGGGSYFNGYGGSDDYGASAMDFSVTNGALLEAMNTIIDIERVSNSADVVASMKVVVEGADVSVAMEGFFSDVITRLKDAFVKLGKTIKSWFDKAVKWFQSLFKSGKDFVDSYGDELKAKSTDGFHYLGYEWNEKKGSDIINKIYGKINSEIDSMVGDLAKAAESTADELSNVFKKTNDGESGYADEVIMSLGIGANDLSQMKAEIKKAFHDGMIDPASDASLTSSQVADYLSWVATGKDTIAKVKKDQSDFESRLSKVINTLNGIAKKEDKGDKGKNATACSKCLTTLFSVKKSAADTRVDCLRSMLKSETAILKKFLHWKGKAATESYDYELAELEMMEALYPDLLPDTIMEEGLVVESVDSYDDSTFESTGDSLFDQVASMIGV